MVIDASFTMCEFYFNDIKKVPLPSKVTDEFVDVPLSVASKILMINAL